MNTHRSSLTAIAAVILVATLAPVAAYAGGHPKGHGDARPSAKHSTAARVARHGSPVRPHGRSYGPSRDVRGARPSLPWVFSVFPIPVLPW